MYPLPTILTHLSLLLSFASGTPLPYLPSSITLPINLPDTPSINLPIHRPPSVHPPSLLPSINLRWPSLPSMNLRSLNWPSLPQINLHRSLPITLPPHLGPEAAIHKLQATHYATREAGTLAWNYPGDVMRNWNEKSKYAVFADVERGECYRMNCLPKRSFLRGEEWSEVGSFISSSILFCFRLCLSCSYCNS